MQKAKILGIVVVLAAGSLWGTLGLFVRYLGELGLDTMNIVTVRIYVTALSMVLLTAVYNRKLFRIKLKDIWCFLGSGLISITGFSFFYFTTIRMTTVAISAVLLYTAPIMVMLMSALLFKETLTLRTVVACALAFCGCFLVAGIIGNGGQVPPLAVLTGLAAALAYASYSILGRIVLNKGYHGLTLTVYTFLFAAIGILPLSDFPELIVAVTNGSPADIAVMLGLGLVATVAPYLLYTTGLSLIETSKASIMASAEPVVATLCSTIVLHEPLSLWGVCGILLVLAAVVVLNLNFPHRTSSSPNREV